MFQAGEYVRETELWFAFFDYAMAEALIPNGIVAVCDAATRAAFSICFEQTGAYLAGALPAVERTAQFRSICSRRWFCSIRHYAEVLGRQLAEALAVWTSKQMINVRDFAGSRRIDHRSRGGARAGVRFLFTERDADRKMSLRRGFTIAPGEKLS